VGTLRFAHPTNSQRHCERSEAIQKAAKKDWISSSQGLLAMTWRVFRQPLHVIASAAKQSRATQRDRIVSPQALLAMTTSKDARIDT
jgi:hypothetical protein